MAEPFNIGDLVYAADSYKWMQRKIRKVGGKTALPVYVVGRVGRIDTTRCVWIDFDPPIYVNGEACHTWWWKIEDVRLATEDEYRNFVLEQELTR